MGPGRQPVWHCCLQEQRGACPAARCCQADAGANDSTARAPCNSYGSGSQQRLQALVDDLRYPVRHRRRWRSTNLLERSLGEVKRRTKVMGRFPGEISCLTLVWAVLALLITHQTNGIRFNQLDHQRLKRARYTGTEHSAPEEVTAA